MTETRLEYLQSALKDYQKYCVVSYLAILYILSL